MAVTYYIFNRKSTIIKYSNKLITVIKSNGVAVGDRKGAMDRGETS